MLMFSTVVLLTFGLLLVEAQNQSFRGQATANIVENTVQPHTLPNQADNRVRDARLKHYQELANKRMEKAREEAMKRSPLHVNTSVSRSHTNYQHPQRRQLAKDILHPIPPPDIKLNATTIDIIALIRELFIVGQIDPDSLVNILLDKDPFQVSMKAPENFVCNISSVHIHHLHGHFDHVKLNDFRNDKKGSYVYFQNLRQTNTTAMRLCDLAYFNKVVAKTSDCVPYSVLDSLAPDKNGIDANKYHLFMKENKHRVAVNEWDVFIGSLLDNEDAVYVTQLKDPLERWYHQYLYERDYLDDAPHSPEPFLVWYARWPKTAMGMNYYTKTFVGNISYLNTTHENMVSRYWTYRSYQDTPITWDMFEHAVKSLSHFSLILISEWMDELSTLHILDHMLGWKFPHKIVGLPPLPSISNLLNDVEYRFIARQNVNDLLFYHIARRIFLERVYCLQHIHGKQVKPVKEVKQAKAPNSKSKSN